MKRIAVIFEGRLHDRKGVFNAVMQRVIHLRDIAPFAIDVHMIEGYDRGLNRWLHGTRRITERPSVAHIDMVDVHAESSITGIDVQMHWFCHSLTDSLRHKVLHRPAKVYRQWLSRLADELRGYDLLSAHDRIAGTAAAMASGRYGMPHYITWHGASIYTDPVHDPVYRQTTIDLLQGADGNFFVSRGLDQYARKKLTSDFKSEILYNGASAAFCRFDDETRMRVRQCHGIGECEQVVGFVGRMEEVKNVLLLPELFARIGQLHYRPLRFVALGDGPQHKRVEQLMRRRGISCLMPGNVPYRQMPEWMNCLDVLVLPSQKEGLPLVALEALACGANVVASEVMGTAEVVGKENAMPLDDNLVEAMAHRTVEMLHGGIVQVLPPDINWETTAQRELKFYESASTHRVEKNTPL